MAFLNGSQRATLFTESSAQFTGITLLNNSLYITDSSLRYTNYLNYINIHFISSELTSWLLCKDASFFSIRIVNVWNDLPANIVDFRSLQSFNKTISTVDFSKFPSDTIHNLLSHFCFVFLFMCVYSCMSYYYLLRLSSFYFPDHCKCYLFSLVTPVYSLHV